MIVYALSGYVLWVRDRFKASRITASNENEPKQ